MAWPLRFTREYLHQRSYSAREDIVAHILIGGDLRAGSAIRSLLQQWGMTCGSWSCGEAGWSYPTINECDAVVLVQGWSGDSTPDPGGSSEAPLAPLLLLGSNPGRLLLARDAWRVVGEPGPEGVDLKFALQSCLEQTGQLRGQQLQHHQGDQEGYLQFLGHELRSPLTAAKTALEVLQGALGGLLAEGAGSGGVADQEGLKTRDSRLKMLDIALRNIKRLHRTVEWSQDLLELETAAPRGSWSQIPVEQLEESVGEAVALVVEDEAKGRFLETDPNLLRILVGQVTRVLDYALPQCQLSGVVSLDSHRERSLELRLSPDPACGGLDGPRITRTHLTSTTGYDECNPREELQRLVGYVVSRTLLEQLQAEALVQSDANGIPVLALRLVLADNCLSSDQVTEDPLASLRTPV